MPLLSVADLVAQGPPAPALLPPEHAEALDQSEIIGLRELHTLAAKLTRRNNHEHAALGRALTRALHGEEMAAHGARNVTAYKLAGEIVEAYPFCDPTGVLECFSASISNSAEHGSKLTLDVFRRQLETHQSKKQGKAETLRDVAERSALGLRPAPAEQVPGAPEQGSLSERGTKDVIVLADGTYYVRHPAGETYELALKSVESLRLELINQFGNANSTLNLIDPMGRMYTNEILLAQYGCNAHKIVKDFGVDATRFDFHTACLRIGQRMLPPTEARDDAHVEAWLRELAGGTDERLEQLYDWIASTDQRYINRPAVACAVVGARDGAKSLFAKMLAMTWGAASAVKLKDATERFNGSIAECPIWHADEELPKELTGHVFRELVQSRSLLIEPKGKEKLHLIGSPRILITVNELADIKIRGANGPDAVAAIGDRLAIFQCSEQVKMFAALDRLRVPGSYDVDIVRIVRHLRAVQLAIEPREQRFYGGALDSRLSEAPVLAAAIEHSPEVFELIEKYLLDPASLEREYHTEDRAFAGAGRQFPLITQRGHLWARYTELAARLGRHEWQIRAALSPFESKRQHGEGRQQIRFGDYRGRYQPLDEERVLLTLGCDLDISCETLGTDTRKRLGIE